MAERIKPRLKPVIGLYTTGHPMYWDQFAGLKDRLLGYGRFIEETLKTQCDVKYFGMVDTVENGRRAGEYFNRENVDLIFLHSATYEFSSAVLPVHQRCKAPIVILNLQPCEKINFAATSTSEWLSQDSACSIPEFCNVLTRAGIGYRYVSGLLGLERDVVESVTDCATKGKEEAERAWKEIFEYVDAAMVLRNVRNSNFGFLGNFYCGMLDMYTDLTLFQIKFGAHVELLELSDLDSCLKEVSDAEVKEKIAEINDFFTTDGDSPSDQIAKAPSAEQLEWSAKVACAQNRMVRKHGLDALAYYCHGRDDHFEEIQSGFVVGHSLLTAAGVPCSGEGDVKTALAMKIMDLLRKGGSFCEIVTTDYRSKSLVIGHDGPFHIDITNDKPIMRGLTLYHGKRGSGISVEASVRPGNVTTFAVAQGTAGAFKLIASEGVAYPAEGMTIGNTETHVDFGMPPAAYFGKWFQAAPTHHFALSIDHNISTLQKIADLMEIELTVI